MKIEKGKLYYNNQLESVVIAVEDSNDNSGILSDKIAVRCVNKQDWDYVTSNGYSLKHYRKDIYYYSLDGEICGSMSGIGRRGYVLVDTLAFNNFYPNDKKRDGVVKVGDMLKNEEGNFRVVDVSKIPQASPEEIINNFKNGGFTFVNSQTDGLNGDEERPEHYAKGIDTFQRMEANCSREECLAFAKGNIDKYNWRTKGQDEEDFKKIISYANWGLKLLKD